MRPHRSPHPLPALAFLGLLLLAGCGGKTDDALSVAASPREAATQLESAFRSAEPSFRTAADAAAAAMRRGEYVEAVESLQVIKATQGATVQQGLAVHGTLVQLEGQLAQGVAAGDPRAQAAYARLKALKAK
jgi:hypothetical protein